MPLPLRITIIGINYSPEETGIAPYTTGLAEGLKRNGHDVRVITTLPHYPEWKVSTASIKLRGIRRDNNVPVKRTKHYVPRRPGFVNRFISEISFGIVSSLSKWNKPDLLILISPGLFSTGIAIIKAKLSQKKYPIVIWTQDIYGQGLAQIKGESFAARTLSAIEKKILGSADKVVIPHEFFAQSISTDENDQQSRFKVIKNWSHVSGFTSQPYVPKEQNNSDGTFLILHTGNMGSKQGLENVVAAAKLAEMRCIPVHFELMGDGSERKRLEELSAGISTLSIVSPVSRDEYLNKLNSADVLLLNELVGVSTMSIPSKLTSYFFAGKPIVASTSLTGTASNEIIASGAGLVVEAGNPEALLDAVIKIKESPELAMSFGLAGKQYAKANLSPESAIASWESLVRALID